MLCMFYLLFCIVIFKDDSTCVYPDVLCMRFCMYLCMFMCLNISMCVYLCTFTLWMCNAFTQRVVFYFF